MHVFLVNISLTNKPLLFANSHLNIAHKASILPQNAKCMHAKFKHNHIKVKCLVRLNICADWPRLFTHGFDASIPRFNKVSACRVNGKVGLSC
jgi:hypothetical protein